MEFQFFESSRAVVLPLFQTLRDTFNQVLLWWHSVFRAFIAGNGQWRPLFVFFVIGIAVVIILVGVRVIRYFGRW